MKPLRSSIFGWLGLILPACVLVAAPVDVRDGPIGLAGAVGFDLAPVRVPVVYDAGEIAISGLVASSNATWISPAIDLAAGELVLTFATTALPSSTFFATVQVAGGGHTDSVQITLTLSPFNPVALLDDPGHGRMYGLHQNGIELGAVVAFDPHTGTPLEQVTVGKHPTDFALGHDGIELFVISSGTRTIDVIEAATLAVTESIFLRDYDATIVAEASPNIGVGPGDILYYTDSAPGPALYVMHRANHTVVQSVPADPVFRTPLGSLFGWGDFAVSRDQTFLAGWSQQDSGGTFATRYSIAPDGRLSHGESSNPYYPSSFGVFPGVAPAAMTDNARMMAVEDLTLDPASLRHVRGKFPSSIYALSPDGSLVTTDDAIHDALTGETRYHLPAISTVQSFTEDLRTLVLFDPLAQRLESIDLASVLGAAAPGRTWLPANEEIVVAPEVLRWPAVSGANAYHVYLGTSVGAVTAATSASTEFLGSVSTPAFHRTAGWAAGTTNYWRVDVVSGGTTATGVVRSFTVSTLTPDRRRLETSTVQSHRAHLETITLTSAPAGESWTVAADVPWLSFGATSGIAPGALAVYFDAAGLAPGFHVASITLTGARGPVKMLVHFEVVPLAVTMMRSDPVSSIVYAVSEVAEEPIPRAFLLEVDSTDAAILRTVPAGPIVTDLAIHAADQRLYVTNWHLGRLLGLSRSTLAVETTFTFNPYVGVGYTQGDVYAVAAGGPGHVVVEGGDQHVDLFLHDTINARSFARARGGAGGGEYSPDHRYYFHGESNNSGARLTRIDTVGDTFANVGSVSSAPNSPSYYGSPIVLVSDDGQRVFWNGTVYDSVLATVWAIGDMIYSRSGDGRHAFAEAKIYDTVQKANVLGMPVTTRVSAFNSISQRLVLQAGGELRAFAVNPAEPLIAPVLRATRIAYDRVDLLWSDESLEISFSLQRRAQGSATWSDVEAALPENTRTYTTFGLQADQPYEFRVRANGPTASSPWSNVLSLRTTPVPAPDPVLIPQVIDATSVALNWHSTDPAASVVIERVFYGRTNWQVVATAAPGASSHVDAGLRPFTRYQYRIKTTRNGVESAYSVPWPVATLAVPSAPVIRIHPVGPITMAGSPVTLSVTVAGTEPFTVQWKRHGVPIPGANSSVFTLPAVLVSDADAYSVEISNALGRTESLPTLLSILPNIYAGVYRGGFAQVTGEWGLVVRADGRATFLAVLGNPAGVIFLHTAVDAQGHIGVGQVRLRPPSGSTPFSSSLGLSISGGGGPVPKGTVQGVLSGGNLNSFVSGGVDPGTGPLAASAGLLVAPASTGAATWYAILASTGSIVAAVLGPGEVEGGVNALDATGHGGIGGIGGGSMAIAYEPQSGSFAASLVRADQSSSDYHSIAADDVRTDRLINISSRGFTGTGGNVMIAGFVVGGSGPRQVLIRGAGPALNQFGVSGTMENPQLSLYAASSTVIAHNDDWGANANATEIEAAAGRAQAFSFASASTDAALLLSLSPGTYTAIAHGGNGATGVVLTEVYDITGIDTETNGVINLSMRAVVGAGDDLLIGGFVIRGNSPRRVLIRAIGPRLADFGLPASTVLANPKLTLFRGATVLVENDNWGEAGDALDLIQAASFSQAFPLAPGSKDAVVLTVLAPGLYSAHVRGVGDTTGIALLEVYELP